MWLESEIEKTEARNKDWDRSPSHPPIKDKRKCLINTLSKEKSNFTYSLIYLSKYILKKLTIYPPRLYRAGNKIDIRIKY